MSLLTVEELTASNKKLALSEEKFSKAFENNGDAIYQMPVPGWGDRNGIGIGLTAAHLPLHEPGRDRAAG